MTKSNRSCVDFVGVDLGRPPQLRERDSTIHLKRVYEPTSTDDGYRILVEGGVKLNRRHVMAAAREPCHSYALLGTVPRETLYVNRTNRTKS